MPKIRRKCQKAGLACEFGGFSQKLGQRLQNVLQSRQGILTLILAIFLFAAAVTVIEFPCSAVLPVLFAGILSQAQLSHLGNIAYIGLFIFFYLLDEIIVFLIAVWTMKVWITSPKFVTWLNLAAAIILLLLASYYIFGLV